MRPKLFCLIFLVCLAAVFVKSETSIEVGDDGDEYEVKRFNIEGRQVNGGRSQCVVTRRKRASAASDAERNSKAIVINGHDDLISSSPTTLPTGVDTNTKTDSDDKDEMDSGLWDQEQYAEGEEGGDGFIHYPVVVHQHGVSIGTANVAGESGDVVAGGEGGEGGVVADPNGVVVVETDKPPKVNPDTHAVFELLPVKPEGEGDAGDDFGTAAGDEGDGDEDGDDDELYYEEETNPVSTTAIWSTGDDTLPLKDLYGDYDNEDITRLKEDGEEVGEGGEDEESEIAATAPAKPVSKPKPKPRPSRRPKPRPKPSKGGKRPLRRKGGKKKRRRGEKRKPSNKNKNKKKKKKKHPNRLPAKNRKSSKRRRPAGNNRKTIKGNRRRRPSKDRRSSSNRRHNSKNRNSNRKRLNNLDKKDKGTHTFTKTETMTATGTANDNKDVNCIIIHKDNPSTTTTPRPFWNILGRNAEGGVGRSGAFGHRKRANLRFGV